MSFLKMTLNRNKENDFWQQMPINPIFSVPRSVQHWLMCALLMQALKTLSVSCFFQAGKWLRIRCPNPTCLYTVWVAAVPLRVPKWRGFSKVPTFSFSVTGFQIRLRSSQRLISGVLKSDATRPPRLSFWSGASRTSGELLFTKCSLTAKFCEL